MALTDVSVMQLIIDDLASAYLNMISTVDLDREPENALYWTTNARERVVIATSGDADDYDYALALQVSLRQLERGLTNSVKPLLNRSAVAINNYFLGNNGMKFRTYWDGKTVDTTLVFSEDFREFWRVAIKEELIVQLGEMAHPWSGGGIYTSVNDDPVLSTGLEIRTDTEIGAAAITVNATLITVNDTYELATAIVPANTEAGTSILLSGTTRRYKGIYQSSPGVYSISATGGTSGDEISIWLR